PVADVKIAAGVGVHRQRVPLGFGSVIGPEFVKLRLCPFLTPAGFKRVRVVTFASGGGFGCRDHQTDPLSKMHRALRPLRDERLNFRGTTPLNRRRSENLWSRGG